MISCSRHEECLANKFVHILILASYGPSLVNFRGQLIRDLVADGHKVSVGSPDCSLGAQSYTDLRSIGADVYEIPLSRTGKNVFVDIRTLVHMRRLMQEIRPDVVLGYTMKPVIYGMVAAWMVGVPRRFALMTGLGYNFTGDRGGVLPRLIRHLYQFALGKATKVLFQNPDDRQTLIALGVLNRKVDTVVVDGSGVDLTYFCETRVHGSDTKFLMIGRLLGDKGVREYAAAARKLRELHDAVSFALAGWIDENPDAIFQSELDSWVQHGDIEYLGHLDDVRPAISDSTVYVLPSYREGTPRTVLEAMSMGRPIITTDAPGCRETVITGENGFLVSVKSVDALIEAMQKFIDDPGLAERMGRRSREIAEEKYDVHKVNAVMLREMGIT